ncbi:LysR family transcriptional regulator [Burkholderiaceae bacterium DAT-1]|nr:LysR family transcriptional regulator [Burkholderiaceae bacterium DAT-1]
MSISLADLALLREVANRGSFSQAAAALRLSQPQVSQRIGVLEDELGIQLFFRHRRGAVATPACQQYLQAVNIALNALEHARQSLTGAPPIPEARVGCPPSLATLVFSPLVAELANAPVELFCHTDHSAELMERVLSGRLKLAFVLNRPSITGLQLNVVARSPVRAVVRHDHPLLAHQGCRIADIANETLSPQWWGPEAEQLISLIRQHRTVAHPIHANQPATTAKELALKHGFIVFMPVIAALDELESGTLCVLPIVDLPDWPWEVMVASRSGKRQDAARDLLLETVSRIGQQWSDRIQALGAARLLA